MSDSDWCPHRAEVPAGKKPSKQKKRKRGRPMSGKKPKKIRCVGKKHSITRRYYTNKTKHQSLQQIDELKKTEDDPYGEFQTRNPAIPVSTAKAWESKRAQITADATSKKHSIRNAHVSASRLAKYKAKFPEQETLIFDRICELRADGVPITLEWVTSVMLEVVKEQKPHGWESFKASATWRLKFFRRFRLSLRTTSNKKSRTVAERLPLVQGFHIFVKALTQPPPGRRRKCGPYGRFPAKARYHVDQVPLEFGGVHSKTVDFKGATRVHVKGAKVDMSRRQASLQLCFNAAGPSVKPGICFRLQPKRMPDGSVDPTLPEDRTCMEQHEILTSTYPGVTLYYQPKAWFDTATCMAFASVFKRETRSRSNTAEKLIGADNLHGQAAPQFRQFMRSKCNTVSAYTPPDCTDLCAVTDSHIGRSIKWRMKKLYDEDYRKRPLLYPLSN